MKLYQRFLASYLCVCLIPLVFSLMMVFNMQQEIQKSIERDRQTTLHTAQSDLESCLVDASNTLDLLSQNEVLENLALRESINGQDLYSMSSLIEALAAANQLHPSYVRSFVYFPRSRYLVSSKSTYHPALTELSTWDLGIDDSALLDGLKGDGSVDVHVQTIYRKDGSGGYLLVSKNWYDSRYQTVYASLGIVIQMEKEASFLNTSTSKMFVLDEDGRLFCGTPNAQLVVTQLQDQDDDQGEVRISGETWLYSVYPTQSLSNLRYGLLMLSSTYYKTLYTVLWQLGAEFLLVAAAGIVLAVFLSRRTWSPIRQVLPLVGKSGGTDGGEYRSLAEFSQALVDFAQEKEKLLEQLMESEERDYDLSVWRYLLGFTHDSSCLSRYLEENQPYRLLAFSPVHPEQPTQQDDAQGVRDRLDNLYKALEQVFLDRQDGICLTIGANTVVVLVQNTVEMEDIRRKVQQVQGKTGQPLVCYVSDECARLADAPEAWNWVKRACGRDSFWQHTRSEGVWLAREVLEYPGYFGDFSGHRKQFLGILAAGKPDKVRKMLDVIVQQDLMNPSLPVELIRHRCGSIIEALLPYLDESDHKEAVDIISADTVQEMESQLAKLVDRVKLPQPQEPPEQPEEKGSQLVAQVQAFIRENYQDPFLNVSLIADRLNRNLSTLSHQYKDLTGHGLLEELHTVRLSAAKTLLKEGKTVRETAELTGYGDSRALIRAFKRYEGSTPGQFVEKK